MNYRDWLVVEPENRQGTRTTKCVKKPYGYYIHRFNNWITTYGIRLIINENGSAKACVKENRNFSAPQQYTEYFDTDGVTCTRSEYQKLNKKPTV